LSTATDPDGGAKTEKKDYLGRVVEVVEHAAEGDAVTTCAYNAACDLLSITNALGVAVEMTFDTLGRKTGIEDPDMGAWGYAYDAAGRVLEVGRQIAGVPRSFCTSRYSCDPAGRLASLVYPDDYQLSYSYHPGTGLLKSVVGITDFTEYAAFESYDAFGRAGYV
jgi:YD repeat-containing protein